MDEEIQVNAQLIDLRTETHAWAESYRRDLTAANLFDPDLAEAHASMGYVHLEQQNAPAALRELQRAVELKPSYAQAHHWLGLVQILVGGGRGVDAGMVANPAIPAFRRAGSRPRGSPLSGADGRDQPAVEPEPGRRPTGQRGCLTRLADG